MKCIYYVNKPVYILFTYKNGNYEKVYLYSLSVGI